MGDFGPLTLGQLRSPTGLPRSAPGSPARPAGGEGRAEPLDAGASAAALAALIEEAALLFRRLGAAKREIHGQGVPSGERRKVLKELARAGPRTVPQLAREWSVTRQHVQALVNRLTEQGYVELIDNPAHKRSHLVRLTPAGKEQVDEMNRREARLLSGLRTGVSEAETRSAAAVVRAVREAFASD